LINFIIRQLLAKDRERILKIMNKAVLLIFIVLYVICTGATASCEPTNQSENKHPSSSFAWKLLKEEKGFHLNLEGSVSYGPISGYLQTPLGGAPSSASDKRPTFKELGINNVTLFNLSFSAGMNQHFLYGAAHLVGLNGENTLDASLVFHGVDYPAGTWVKSDVRLNWYELGYRYTFEFGKERTNLRIAPTIAFALMDFNAGLESNGDKNNRSYMQGTPRIGLEIEWLTSTRFSVSGKAIGSLPFRHTPQIYTFGLIGKYNILDTNRLRMLLFAGVEYDLIEYKDSQATPNHLNADMGPLATLGVEINF
jgi:hypothetical protein